MNKVYEPSATLELTFKGNDLTIVTNSLEEAVTLFIGKRKPNGAISGERYTRRIIR